MPLSEKFKETLAKNACANKEGDFYSTVYEKFGFKMTLPG